MKINQLKAGVVLSYISEGILVLVGLIYTPVMLRMLGKGEYGLYQLATSVIAYLSLLSLGMGRSYVRYYSKYKVKNDNRGISSLNGMFMTVFIIIGVICILAGSVLIGNVEYIFKKSLTAYEIKAAKVLMSFMVFNLSISFPGSVFGSYITANEQYVFQRLVNILRNILNPFLTLPLLFMGYKSIAVVVVQTILSILALVANWYFCKRKLGMSFDFKSFQWGFFKGLLVFSFFIFLNQIIDQINWSIDKFVLGIFGGTAAVAVYSVASQLNMFYFSFSTSISGVFAPKVNRIVAEKKDGKLLTELFTKVGRIQFIILALVLSGLVVFGRFFISIWAGAGYEETYIIALLLTASATIPLIQNIGIDIQFAKNMHKFRSVVYFAIALVNAVISIPLAKYYGGTGAAFGTAVSILIGNGLIMNIYYHKRININMVYFWKRIISFIPALLAPALFGIVIMMYITFSEIYIFVGFIVAYVLVYCVSMWLWGLNEFEKDLVCKPLKRIINRRKLNGKA